MDPTLRTKIIERLKRELDGYAPRLKVVAKYLIDHPADFGLDPIRVTGRKAGVSTFTLVRLAHELGFAGFDELREPFRKALVALPDSERPDWLSDMAGAAESGAAQAAAAANAIGIVNRSLCQQPPEVMEKVADMMIAAPRVYITAARASYALAYFLHYVGRVALPALDLIPRHMNSPIDELGEACAGEVMVAITFTPYSRETIEACRFARSRGVKLVLISDSGVAPPELQPEVTLVVTSLTTHHFGCYTGAMAVVENLIATLVTRAGPAAQERIAAYESLRHDHAAYWNASRKH